MTIGLQDLGIALTGDIADLQRNLTAGGSAVDSFGRKTQGALREVAGAAQGTDDAMSRLAGGIKSMFVGSSVAAGLIALKSAAMSTTSALVDAQVQLDRLNNGFAFGAGGAEAGAKEMAFVRAEADRLGLSFGAASLQYMKMVAASRGHAMAGEKTRQLFTSIAEAATVMGMSEDQTERSMAAVVQMMSKGKVTAEELRGQLGEHLPGAFSIAAQAMGVTEAELNKLMETGSVMSDDFLPKFGAKLHELMSGSVAQSALSMQANLNRLSTAWLNFKQQLSQGGVGSAIGTQTKTLATELDILGETLEASRQRGDGFWMSVANMAGAATGRVAFQVLQDVANANIWTFDKLTGGVFNLNANLDLVPDNLKPMAQQLELTGQKVQQAEAEYASLAVRLSKAPDNIYLQSELGRLAIYIDTLKRAQVEQAKLMGAAVSSGNNAEDAKNGRYAAAAMASERARQERQSAYQAAMRKYATPQEKLSEELKSQKEAMGDLFSPELEQRITANFIKPTRAGAKAIRDAKDEFADLYGKLMNKDSGLDPAFYKDLNTLHKGYQSGRIDIDEYRAAVTALINSQKFATDAAREHTEAMNVEERFMTIVRDKQAKWDDEKAKANETAAQMMLQIQQETAMLGMNATEREIATAMRELERKEIVQGTAAYELYAEAIKKAIIDREQARQMLQFWSDFESTAQDVFMDVAMNGEDAFKRIGESIKRYLLQMLYEMTVKKWIIQIAGSYGGGLQGNGANLLASAAQSYMTGGSALGSSASAAGSWLSGSMSTANMYGSVYANAAGTGMDGLLATNGAYGTAGSAGSAAGSAASSSWMAYANYAILIAAAIVVAEGLYKKGWNREALGEGQSKNYRFGYSTYSTDPGAQKSQFLDKGILNLEAKNQRALMDAVGMSEKWADIFSGSVRMATLIGRKLSGYGYEANISGGDVAVSGYAKYKGGVFRSNKTRTFDVDPRDAEMLQAQIEAVREGSRSMAAALGYSGEAIDRYTGKLRINMKGADTAAEQSERMAKAMDDLQFELLKAASGGKMARAEFDRLMETVKADIEAAGISAQGMTGIVVDGMMNGSSGEEIGAALSNMVIGGIYKTIAEQAFAPVAAAIMTQLVTPVFTALMAGVPVAQAISQSAIDNIVGYATAAAETLKALFDNEAFREAMATMGEGFAQIGDLFGGIEMPDFGQQQIDAAAEEVARQRAQMEMELLRLEGNTVEIRRRELEALDPSLRALQELIWAREEENAALDERKGLEKQLWELQGNTTALRQAERDALHESNRELYDQIQALKDAQELKDIWKDLTDSIYEEVARIKGLMLGGTTAGLVDLEAQFALATAQARANDQAAAGKLPDLASQLEEQYRDMAASRAEYEYQIGGLLASLQETADITAEQNGVNAPAGKATQTVRDDQLAGKVDGLQRVMTEHAGIMAKVLTALEDVTDGRVLRTKAVA